MPLHLLKGKSAEEQARQHLEQRGLQLLVRNYRCKRGEIDLIMQDGDTLVFIEVRYRKSANYGTPVESITAQKQHRLLATAKHYLQRQRVSVACRFDVIGITGSSADSRIDWIKDAFRSDG
jgi:putative endonuclease